MNAGQFWTTFQRFFIWGIEAWALPPFLVVGLISLGSILVALLVRNRETRTHWQLSYWFVFTQLLFFPLVIAVGTGFQGELRGPNHTNHTNSLGAHLLDALFVASLITACFWVYRMKGLRWLAIGLVVLQEALLFGAFFIAGMAVSGDWI